MGRVKRLEMKGWPRAREANAVGWLPGSRALAAVGPKRWRMTLG